MAVNLTIQLPKFEGPLHLLLYLIRKEEMDIFDIEIHHITEQFLEYLKIMKELDLERAGDFISMASTLLHIKSRMLLPTYNEDGEIVESEDPRKELVQKLLEYERIQEATRKLYERPLRGRDFWVRGLREKLEAPADEVQLEDNALFMLITSYKKMITAASKKIHQVAAKVQSIANRILEIKDRLLAGVRVTLSELITASSEEKEVKRKQILITFLSLLELGKLGFVKLFQTSAYQEIYVDVTKNVETDVLSRVEEYESLHQKDDVFAGQASNMMAQNLTDQEVLDLESDEADQESHTQAADTIPFELPNEDFIEDDLATDEEILQAEQDLEKEENLASDVLLNELSSDKGTPNVS